MPEGYTTVFRKFPLDCDPPLTRGALSACSVRFPVDQLLSRDKARARTFGSDGATVSTFTAMGADSGDDELNIYSDEDDGKDGDLTDGPFESHVTLRLSLRKRLQDHLGFIPFSQYSSP